MKFGTYKAKKDLIFQCEFYLLKVRKGDCVEVSFCHDSDSAYTVDDSHEVLKDNDEWEFMELVGERVKRGVI